MAVEPLSEIAYIAGEAVSEKVGEKLDKVPLWKKVSPYLLFVPFLICLLWFIAFDL